ncbi:hypothetical protein ACQ4PT_061222 [Festuca glaucescens]
MSGWSSRMYRKRSLTTMGCSSKRRGRTTPAGVTSSAEPDASSSWASMQGDLVRLIGWRLLETSDLLDYVRFRAVCPHWRSSTLCPRGRGVADPRFHPRRWMMLPEGHGLHPGHSKLGKYIRFVNLSTGAIIRSKLPIFSDHCVLDSVDGPLLLQRDQDTAIRLLHPFTGDIAELPPLITLLRLFKFQFSPTEDSPETRRVWIKFRKVGSTSVSVSADGVITVMIVISGIKCLAIATVGDQQWSVARRKLSFSQNPVSLQGRIYILDHVSTTTRIFQILASEHRISSYLAECDSEILLICLGHPIFSRITVYRLADLTLGRFVPVKSIGDNVLFVSERILSVSSKVLPNVEGNSLVMVPCGKKVYFGQYQLSTSTWFPAADGSMSNFLPGPCSLIHHIFTCCHRDLWNKGAISFQVKGNLSWNVKRKWRYGA